MRTKHITRVTGVPVIALVCAAISVCAFAAPTRTVIDSPLTHLAIYAEYPRQFENTTTIEDEPTPLAEAFSVLSPDSSGEDTDSGGGATVDHSNVSEGYVMVKFSGEGKIKVQITKKGSKTYTYDLRSDGVYEVYPLTSGNGNYTLSVYKNAYGNQYATVMSTSFNVELRNSMLPFLYPSQYVNFNAKSKAVAKGAELAGGSTSQLAIVSNVYNYVVKNITYDNNKANKAKAGQMTGYLPSVDSTLSSGKGICFDYAALMTAMLRSQNIPTRLEIGYVSGGLRHAWISVYINGVGWVNDLIYFDGKSWKMMDPTFASGAKQSSSIMQFIGNGKNYSTQYIY